MKNISINIIGASTESYPTGITALEILEYLNHVADRFALRKNIEFNTEVVSARFNDERSLWEI